MTKKLENSLDSASSGSKLPHDYPFGDRVSESIADYAKRMGVSVGAMRNRADRGTIPIIQPGPGKKREVNLYAIYMNARYKGERYTEMMN
ncbi:DNA-binding protein [Enterobacter roggenkampii]|uniref:DNA-binding protein n=1 Tax=Enterobacter roggenkampii TaxID=1812935 RepID=UPI0018C25EC0|nr:DNA-binding protein [Enterobacter roggenkampii]MBF9817797.1 DNA-binding protein [Enterobacter roggenkampii]